MMDYRAIIESVGTEPFKFGETLSKEYIFSVALKIIDIRESSEIETACVYYDRSARKVVMAYNPAFFDFMAEHKAFDETELKAYIRGVVKHELLHFMLKHLVPDPARPIGLLRNIAMDALINTCVPEFQALRSKLKTATPEEAVQKPIEFDLLVASAKASSEDWNWEMYYDHLLKLIENSKIENAIFEKNGTINGTDVKETQELDEATAAKIEELMEQAKEAGTLPGRFIEEINAKLKRSKLEKLIHSIVRDVYAGRSVKNMETYKRPSRRFDTFPGTRKRYVSKRIVVMVDVSASISSETLTEFVSQAYTLAKAYGYDMDVFTYDVGVQNRFTNKQVRRSKFEIQGRGGTDLSKALKDLQKYELKDIHSMVIFTDGYDTFPKLELFPCKNLVFVFPQDHSPEFEKQAQAVGKVHVLEV